MAVICVDGAWIWSGGFVQAYESAHINQMRGLYPNHAVQERIALDVECIDPAIKVRRQSGNLHADAVVNTLTNRAPELTDQVAWHTFYSLWAAWTYAWQQVQLLNR
jgi:hypothetical protein